MQEADGYGLDSVLLQLGHRRLHIGFIQRRQNLPGEAGALINLQTQIAGHQGLIGRDKNVVHGGANVLKPPADLDDVEEVLRGDHPGLGPVLVDQRVGGQSGAVNEEFHLA
ncbi:MAG TPA: hypothetical protein VJM80_13425 [bacterium]|nr:hypothetical protein [bacterium]